MDEIKLKPARFVGKWLNIRTIPRGTAKVNFTFRTKLNAKTAKLG